jgi:hypothetical protein
MGVFDGKLRLSVYELAAVTRLLFILTRHHQGRQAQSKILAQRIFGRSGQVVLRARQNLGRGGTGRWTKG